MGQQKKAFRTPRRDGALRGEGAKPEYVPPDAEAWEEWWSEWEGMEEQPERYEGADADASNDAADEPLTER